MSDADKLTVRKLFDATAEIAAADMRKRAILVLVEMARVVGTWDATTLNEVRERIERLPIVEERR